MVAALATDWLCNGAKQRHCGQPVYKPARQQHNQQFKLKQHKQQHYLQRASTGQHTTAKRNCPCLHGWRNRQLFDWHIRVGVILSDWLRRWNISTGRTVRTVKTCQDHERVRIKGGCCSHPLSGHKSVSWNGYGWNAMPVPWRNWKTSHDVVAAKP